MESEFLMEALRAFLRRRLRQRVCRSGSWTGGRLKMLVADCAFVAEPYAFLVHALVGYLDEPGTPRAVPACKGGNWITQAFGTLAQKVKPTRSLQSYDPPDLPVNWVTAAFDALSGRPVLGDTEAPLQLSSDAGEGWISDALVAASRREL
ncbi:unnamed protein product [Symbiodinium natans]|uniref:Uncharacterized protein n=1 Tax=Symbiodinium natans TaxID=878477 RepID=A0A812Q169_9DINO|nr:unnamed protein product [Symbiodinium natans]